MGGNDGSGGGGGGDDYAGGPDGPVNTDPLVSDWDGNSIATYPVIGDKSNIKELNKLTNNKADGSKTIFKQAIDNLKERLATDVMEDGLLFGSQYAPLPPSHRNGRSCEWTDFPPSYYITIHMHQNQYYPPPTPGSSPILKPTNPVMSPDYDVLSTLNLYKYNGNKNTTTVLVSRQGTFAIRISNGSQVVTASNTLNGNSDELKAFNYKYNFLVMTPLEATPSDEQGALIGVIEFINTHLVNGKPLGVSIYQAVYDADGNIINWIKL